MTGFISKMAKKGKDRWVSWTRDHLKACLRDANDKKEKQRKKEKEKEEKKNWF